MGLWVGVMICPLALGEVEAEGIRRTEPAYRPIILENARAIPTDSRRRRPPRSQPKAEASEAASESQSADVGSRPDDRRGRFLPRFIGRPWCLFPSRPKRCVTAADVAEASTDAKFDKPRSEPLSFIHNQADSNTASDAGEEPNNEEIARTASSTTEEASHEELTFTDKSNVSIPVVQFEASDAPSPTGALRRDAEVFFPADSGSGVETAQAPDGQAANRGRARPSGPPLGPAEEANGFKPIGRMSVNIAPSPGELPTNHAAGWFSGMPMQSGNSERLRPWMTNSAAWEPTAYYHDPLYFEEPNLERYGYKRPWQSVVSAGHFGLNLAILPYKFGAQPYWKRQYALGRYRPGSPVPYRAVRPPLSVSGGALQALVITGLIALP